MFGLFKKKEKKEEKKSTLVKFEMLGFTETALNSFDNFLLNGLLYDEYDSEVSQDILPGSYKFDYIDSSFMVNFLEDRDIKKAMTVAGFFSSNLDKYYKPTYH